MKIAVIGSRGVINSVMILEKIMQNIPENCSEIVSGNAVGVDTLAKTAAGKLKLKYTGFDPNYIRFGKNAPLIRNVQIVRYADLILAFWDFSSDGTRHAILQCIKDNKPFRIIRIPKTGNHTL